MSILIRWVISAIALFIVTQIVPGVRVDSMQATLIAALVIGLVNATLGSLLKVMTLPLGCLTLGISGLIINALMFLLADYFVSGFHVDGFLPAFLGSIVMSLVGGGLDFLLNKFTSGGDDRKA